jgi:gluconolactonase
MEGTMMTMRTMALLGFVSLAVSCGGEPMPAPEPEPAETMPAEAPSAGAIERLDPALDELVSPDAVIEHLADGFQFTEGPFWVPEAGGFLLFSDVPGNRMIKWTPAGEVTDFIAPVFDGDYEGGFVGSNGITGDSDGNIVFAEHYNGRISRISPDGTGRSIVVDAYEGVRFNSPNDLVYKSDGSLYFTDPAYGLPPETQGQDVHGIYRLSQDGAVERLAAQQAANGLAFSPDESRLYVSGGGQWMVYEVAGDGTLGEGALFLEGGSDGMKVDERGNLWGTGRGGVWVISPEGVHLGTIAPDESPANVAFGDADGRTLYMTAVTGLYRVRTNVAGN